MAKKKILWGILAISLVFVIMSIGCSSGSGGEKKAVEKTLVITGLTGTYADLLVALYSTTTSGEDDFVAIGGWDSDQEAAKKSGSTYTFQLFKEEGGASKWTGNGSYHVYILATLPGGKWIEYFTKDKQNFSSASTTIAFSKFTEYARSE